MKIKTRKRHGLSLFCIILISIGASWAQMNPVQARNSYKEALEYKRIHEFKKADSILVTIHAQDYNDSKFRIQLWDLKTTIKRNLYQTDSALYFCHLGLQCATSIHSTKDEISFHTIFQQLYCRQGNLTQALSHIQEAVLLCGEGSNRKELAHALKRKAEVYILMGRTDLALQSLDRALTEFKRLSDGKGEQNILLRIGRLYMNVGEFATSEKYIDEAIEIAKKDEDKLSLGYLYYRKTTLYMEWNKLPLAQKTNERAFLNSDSIKYPGIYGQILLHKAILHMRNKDYQSAHFFANRSYNMYAKNRQIPELAKIFLFRSQLYVKLDKPRSAVFWIDSAILMSKSFHDPFIQLKIYHQKAMVSKLVNDEKTFLQYSALLANVKDSISGIENLRAVLNREMNESERIRRQKAIYDNEKLVLEKKKKLSAIYISRTLLFLSIFIILGGGVLLIIKNKKKKKWQNEVNHQLEQSKMKLTTLIETGAVPKKPMPRHFIPLSHREQEVFTQLILGKTDKQIAETLFISAATVRTHVRHIYEKFHISSRIEAKVLSEKYELF